MIYFILSPSNSLVKIGYSKTPKRRFSGLQAACPVELVYLGDIPGGSEVERKLHTYFFGFHARNEWFHYRDSLRGDVVALIAGWFDHSRLPEKGVRSWALAERASGKLTCGNGRRRRAFDIPTATPSARTPKQGAAA